MTFTLFKKKNKNPIFLRGVQAENDREQETKEFELSILEFE